VIKERKEVSRERKAVREVRKDESRSPRKEPAAEKKRSYVKSRSPMREKSPYSYKSCKSLNKPTASPTYLDCVNFLIRNPAITPLLSVKET